CRVLQPDPGRDLAGADLLALLPVVGVHLEDAADPLGLAGVRVQDPVAGLELPEYTRKYVSLPTYGSDMTLNASAEKGSSVAARRESSCSVRGSTPCTGGTSSGLGR